MATTGWDGGLRERTLRQLLADVRAALALEKADLQELIPGDGGKWYYDRVRDVVMIDGRKYVPESGPVTPTTVVAEIASYRRFCQTTTEHVLLDQVLAILGKKDVPTS